MWFNVTSLKLAPGTGTGGGADRKPLLVRMVNRCVAAGCSNTPGEGISLYKFPSDPALLEKWVKQVQQTRAQWTVTKY